MTDGLSGEALDRATGVFADFLKKQGLMKKTPAIIEEFRAYAAELTGARTIELESAAALSDGLKDEMKQIFGERVTIHELVNPALIGGVVVRDRDTIYDASARGELTRLAASIT